MTVRDFNTLLRDFNESGVPGSGKHEPVKADMRDTFNDLFLKFTGANAGAIVKTSKANLDGDLAHDPDTMAWVVGDATAANDGVYQKSGAKDAGSWTKRAPLPYPVIHLNNAGAGTGNAIVATTAVGTPSAAYGVLYFLNVTSTNTSETVTVAVNGATARPLKTRSGLDPAVGALTTGMVMIVVDDGTNYRALHEFDAVGDPGLANVNAALRTTQIIGTTGVPEAGTTTHTHTFAFVSSVMRAGSLHTVEAYAASSGVLKIKRFDAAWTHIETLALTMVAGLNVFGPEDLAGLGTFQAGDHVAVHSASLAVKYDAVFPPDVLTKGPGLYYINAGDVDEIVRNIAQLSIYNDVQVRLSFGAYEPENVEYRANVAPARRAPFTLGSTAATISAGNAANNTGITYLFSEPVPANGRMTAFRCYASAAGPVYIVAYYRNGNTLHETDERYGVQCAAGSQTIPLNIPVKRGYYYGVQARSGNLTVDTTTRFSGRGYFAVASGATVNVAFSTPGIIRSSNLGFAMDFDLESGFDDYETHRLKIGEGSTIAVIGNSYSAGAFAPDTKGWVRIASRHSDYVFHNFSQGGDDPGARLTAIRDGVATFSQDQSWGSKYSLLERGVTYREYGSEYVIIILQTNTPSLAELIAETRDLLVTVMATGAKPIMICEHREPFEGSMAAYRQLAAEIGVDFIDLFEVGYRFPITKDGFDSGGHGCYRVQAAYYALPVLRKLNALLGAPREGIKLYHPHPDLTPSDIDGLLFDRHTDINRDLQAKWTEISLGSGGHMVGDGKYQYMDEVVLWAATYNPDPQTFSDYLKLWQGHPVAFSDYALARVFIDARPPHVKQVRLWVGSAVSTAYVHTTYGGTYAAAGLHKGFWRAVPVTGGYVTINSDALEGALTARGEIAIALEQAGAFNLQNVHVEWTGKRGKTDWRSPNRDRQRGAELIAHPELVSGGALATGWTATGVLDFGTGIANTDLPRGTTGDCVLGPGETVSVTTATFTADGFRGRDLLIDVEACADRAVVVVGSAKVDWSMTETSDDTEVVRVSRVAGGTETRTDLTLVPYWTSNEVITYVEPADTAVTIKISNPGTGNIRIARVSARFLT